MIGTQIKMVGYLPAAGVDIEEYRDYIDRIRVMNILQFQTQLNVGTLPPGLVIIPDGGIQGIVVNHDEKQHVKPYQGQVRI